MSNRPPPMTPMEWVALVLTVGVLIFVAWANSKDAFGTEPLRLQIGEPSSVMLAIHTPSMADNTINVMYPDKLYFNGVPLECHLKPQEPTPMTTPPINDKGKTERKPEHPDIVRARADVNNAATEYEHASQAAAATLRKLQQAQEALAAELAKPRRE